MGSQVGDKVMIVPDHPLYGKISKCQADMQGEVISCGNANLLNRGNIQTASVRWSFGTYRLIYTYAITDLVKVDGGVYEDEEVL